MQNRHLTGEEKNPKTKEELIGANGGIPLLTNLCPALRSDQENLCAGGDIRGDTMLSGKVKEPRGQLQCRMDSYSSTSGDSYSAERGGT